jgi:hypothetical protein
MFKSSEFLHKVILYHEVNFKSAKLKRHFTEKQFWMWMGSKVSETQIKTPGIGATTIFPVILSHESLLGIRRHESRELSVSMEYLLLCHL